MRRTGPLAMALLLAACSGEPTPQPTPGATAVATPTPTPKPPPSSRILKPGQLPTPELDGAVALTGAWRSQGSAALYESEGAPAFAVRCNRPAQRIELVRTGTGATLRLFTDDAAATFPAVADGGAAMASITTGQTFLDALARADAIGVALDGAPVVRLPGNGAIGDIVRRCRPGGR
jgi:hypothetical protein